MKRCVFPSNIIIAFFWLIFIIACNKTTDVQSSSGTNTGTTTPRTSPADIVAYSILGQNAQTNISQPNWRIMVRFPDSVINAENMIASFMLSPNCSADINGIAEQSGITKNSFYTDLIYNVAAADGSKENWKVTATNNDTTYDWGLGHFFQKSLRLNKNYDWYIDQMNTGQYAGVNCGPSSVTMAIHWSDSSFNKTAEYARSQYESQGGWWYTNDVDDYLSNNQISHSIISLTDSADQDAQIMKQKLDEDEILILCLDMNYVQMTSSGNYRVDKFYTTTSNWGHFIVVKGYEQVDNEIFFECYDPYSFGEINADQSLRGENRFYRAADLHSATNNWWKYVFVIAKRGQLVHKSLLAKEVNINNIPSQHGR